MSLVIKNSVVKPNDGTYQAVCYNIWDIGKQEVTWQGKTQIKPQFVLAFELDKIIPEGNYAGQRFTVYKKVTAMLGKRAALRVFVLALKGSKINPADVKEGFDAETCIGENCQLQLITNEAGWQGIASVSSLMETLAPITPTKSRDEIPNWVSGLIEAGKLIDKKLKGADFIHDETQPIPKDEESNNEAEEEGVLTDKEETFF